MNSTTADILRKACGLDDALSPADVAEHLTLAAEDHITDADEGLVTLDEERVAALRAAAAVFSALHRGTVWLRHKPLFGSEYPPGPPCTTCGLDHTVAATSIEGDEELHVWRCPGCGAETPVEVDHTEGRMS